MKEYTIEASIAGRKIEAGEPLVATGFTANELREYHKRLLANWFSNTFCEYSESSHKEWAEEILTLLEK